MPGVDIQAQIFDNLKTHLETNLTWATVVEWEKIKLGIKDIMEHEVPYVQFYSPQTFGTNNGAVLEMNMTVIIEVILRQDSTALIDQRDLLDKLADVRKVIGQRLNLNIPQVVHFSFNRQNVDLHTIVPYYFGQLTFDVLYNEKYGYNC